MRLLILGLALVLARTAQAEPAKPLAELEVACSLPGQYLHAAYSGVDLQFERAGKALVGGSRGNIAFLSAPDCATNLVMPAPKEASGGFSSVTVGGDVLYDGGHRVPRTIYLKKAERSLVSMQDPDDLGKGYCLPVLSDDGSAIVWLVTQPVGGGNIEQHLQVRDLDSGAERKIPLAPSRMKVELIAANVGADEYTLVGYPNEVRIVNAAGQVKWGPVKPSEIENVSQISFRRIAEGWVAWDFVRIDGKPQRLQWSLPQGKGQRDLAVAGPGSVSVSPNGRFIAVRAAANKLLGDGGSVAIVRVSDGTDLFFRALENGTGPGVAFLGSEYLAIDSKGGVEVLRLPASEAQAQSAALAKAEPTKVPDIPGRIGLLGERLAKQFGLVFERPNAATRSALLGPWKAQKGPCGDGEPFIEFRDDGSAYGLGPFNRKYTYTIGEHYIEVREEKSSDAIILFQMSGGFYRGSHECLLVKLERLP